MWMATYTRRLARELPFTWDKTAGQFVRATDLVEFDELPPRRTAAKLANIRSRFLKGPVPWGWIIRASELPGKALIVGLCLWRLSGAMGKRTVTLGNAELEPFGID